MTTEIGPITPASEYPDNIDWDERDAVGYTMCVYGEDGDEPGDCHTRVGEDGDGQWWVDEGDETERCSVYGPYPTRDAAMEVAERLATEMDESDVADERRSAAERRRSAEQAEEEARWQAEEEARWADEIADIPGSCDPVWVAVDMDGHHVHGPARYAEVDALVRREAAEFAASRPEGDRSYMPRSIVRSDRRIVRDGQWSTTWRNG